MSLATQPDQFSDRIAFLKTVPLFAQLDEETLTQVARDFRVRQYRKADTIFHQGDLSQGLYVIKEGKVRIFHLTPNGDETTINILFPRQVMGEFALIDELPRSASAQALTPCLLLEIPRGILLQYLSSIPGLALALCHQLTKKARWTSTYAEAMAQLDIRGRLLTFVFFFLEQVGRVIEPDKIYELDLGLSQNDLATLVGANRGWVNHILQQWREEKFLEYNGGKITVLDLPQARLMLDSMLFKRDQGILK